jgi:hypothetical protein
MIVQGSHAHSRSRSPVHSPTQPIMLVQPRQRSISYSPDRRRLSRSPTRIVIATAANGDYIELGKVIEEAHYVTRWQLWSASTATLPLSTTESKDRDERQHRWSPYDPDKNPQEVPKEYPSSRFIVNIRHRKPYDEPELVLSDFSKPIIAFMRYADQSSPT